MEPENPWAAPRAHTVARPTSVEAPDRRLFWAMMAMEVGVTLFNVIAAITAIDRVHGPGVLAAYSATLAMLTGVEACWTWRLLLAAEGRGGPGRIPALLAALLAQIPMFGWPFWLLALRDAWQKLGDDDAPAPMWGEAACLLSLLAWCNSAAHLLFRPQRDVLIQVATMMFLLRSGWVYQARAERGPRPT